MQGVKQFVQSGSGGTADLNKTAATAVNLPALNGVNTDTKTGNIGTDGLNTPGKSDIDLYKFTMNVTGNLFVTLSTVPSGATFNPTLRIFDLERQPDLDAIRQHLRLSCLQHLGLAAGNLLRWRQLRHERLIYPLTGAGVIPGNGLGDYQITVTVTPPTATASPPPPPSRTLTPPTPSSPPTSATSRRST